MVFGSSNAGLVDSCVALTDLEALWALVAPLDAESALDRTLLCRKMSLFLRPSYLEL